MTTPTDPEPTIDPAPSAPAPTSSGPTPVTIKCGCNRTREDNAVVTEPQYGFLANLTLLFGVTAAPKRIDWKCLQCGKTIASADDPATIRKFTH